VQKPQNPHPTPTPQPPTCKVDALVAPKVEEAAKERAAAEARARALATAAALQARVRAGRVSPAAAGALLALAVDEVASRLAEGDAAPGGLTPSAGAEVLSLIALGGGALAALSAALHDGGGGAGGDGPPAALEAAIDGVEAAQREIEAALAAARAAAGAAAGASAIVIEEEDGEEGGEGGGREAEPVSAAARVGPSLAELRRLAEEVGALPAPPGLEEDEGGGMEGLLAEMRNDISTRVSESTAALAGRAEAAAAAARDRERAALVLRRGKAIAAAAAATGEGGAAAGEGTAPDGEKDLPSSPVKRLAYAEQYLRQLGGRSLGGALPDVSALLAAVGGAKGLGGGLDLDAASQEAAVQLERLTDEVRARCCRGGGGVLAPKRARASGGGDAHSPQAPFCSNPHRSPTPATPPQPRSPTTPRWR
jgi:hypothetical protein